ncbi:glyoxalase [Aquimarina sp. ERC-38]|uniref:glyoxalase n=1 Tax=Aquimarina sp. ERC-38 TaxID=2949996 RepID=UPI002247C807|nr:glyoxalase [Aquimarina sp. ERC-38]UZO79548.1 glyoxalase [Aquimarina sp. ERC-38]
MDNREQHIKTLRPEISKARVLPGMSEEEKFQNITLRPIIKLQNDLLIAVFQNYIVKRKNVFYNLTLEKKLTYMEYAVQKDMKFRNSIKGMIIGLFTVKEYQEYIKNSSALNKRMMNIVKERLWDNVQVFDKPRIAI